MFFLFPIYFHFLSFEIRVWLFCDDLFFLFHIIFLTGGTKTQDNQSYHVIGSGYLHHFPYTVKNKTKKTTSCCSCTLSPCCLPIQTERIVAEGAIGALWTAHSCWGAGGEVSVPNPAAGAGPQQWRTTQDCTAQTGGKHLPGKGNQDSTAGWGGTVVGLVCLRSLSKVVLLMCNIEQGYLESYKYKNIIHSAYNLLQSK